MLLQTGHAEAFLAILIAYIAKEQKPSRLILLTCSETENRS